MTAKPKSILISVLAACAVIVVVGALVFTFSLSSPQTHHRLDPRIYQLKSAGWLTFPWWKGGELGIYHNARDISIVEELVGVGPNPNIASNITVSFYTAKGELLSSTGSRPFITTWQPKGIETQGGLVRLRR